MRPAQRAAITLDPAYRGGHYYPAAAEEAEDREGGGGGDGDGDGGGGDGRGPVRGMEAARKFGTICYRSRGEFDGRFDWRAKTAEAAREGVGAGALVAASSTAGAAAANVGGSSGGGQQQQGHGGAASELQLPLFEVESYLNHAAAKFAPSYDANCYLLMSRSMDLMDLGDAPRQGTQRETQREEEEEEEEEGVETEEEGREEAAGAAGGSSEGKDERLPPPPPLPPPQQPEGQQPDGQHPEERLLRALSRVPERRQVMLLSYSTDTLMPPSEGAALAASLGGLGRYVRYSLLTSDVSFFYACSPTSPLLYVLVSLSLFYWLSLSYAGRACTSRS